MIQDLTNIILMPGESSRETRLGFGIYLREMKSLTKTSTGKRFRILSNMTAYAYFPKLVKVLEVYDNWEWGWIERRIVGHKWIVGKYYIAEHSKTYPLEKGDCFIIKEKYYVIKY